MVRTKIEYQTRRGIKPSPFNTITMSDDLALILENTEDLMVKAIAPNNKLKKLLSH